MSRPRFLYFDLGKVLVDFDHDLMCRQLAAIADAEFEFVKRLIFGQGELMRMIEVGEISSEECYARFLRGHRVKRLRWRTSNTPLARSFLCKPRWSRSLLS